MRYAFGVLFFVSSMLPAQVVRVGVRSSIEAALENHASIRISRARVNAAEAQLDESGARLLPKLQVIGRAFSLSDVEQGTITVPFLPGSPSIPLFPVITHSHAARVQVSQPLFNGFRLSEAKEVARYGFEAAQADREHTASGLALQVEEAYWGWVQSREAQRVMEETVEQIRGHEERVVQMAGQGLTTQADVLSIRVRRSDVQVKAVEMGTRAALAAMRLNSLMGLPLETELEPVDLPSSVDVADPQGASDALVERALGVRPDVQSARLRTDMSSSAVSMANGGWYPSISLAAAYEYSNPNQRIIPPKDRFDGTWEVGLTFQWTVWDWMTTSRQVAQAEAQHQQAEAGYELMVDGVRLEIAQLSRQLGDSREKLSSARLAVESAEESFRVVEERFEKGLATSVDATDARVEVLRAQLALSQAGAETAVTRAYLRRAMGEKP